MDLSSLHLTTGLLQERMQLLVMQHDLDHAYDHDDDDDDDPLASWDLSVNLMDSIPPSLLQLAPRLRLLDLSTNQLVMDSIAPLAACINLSYLYLYGNLLEGPFPPELLRAVSQLQYLSLHSNAITGLPQCTSLLTRLEYLHVGGNRLLDFPLDVLSNCTKLDTLNLAGNPQLATIAGPHIGRIQFFTQ